MSLRAGGATGALLASYRDELPMLFIVSQVELDTSLGEQDALHIDVVRAEGQKCARCWRIVEALSSEAQTDGICDRCITAVGGQQAA